MPKAERPSWWSTDDWETPWSIVREQEKEFGRFQLDPCATATTAKARKFYTIEDNGLFMPWTRRVFLNPPYSDPLPWVRWAAIVTKRSRTCPLVVALLPSATDTAWFHDWVLPYAEVRWIRGRIGFIGWMGTPLGSPRNPNFWAIYRKGYRYHAAR